MKTLLTVLTLFVATTSFTVPQLQYVYIDANPKAAGGYYHDDKHCKGLKKGDKVVKISLTEAINKYHYKACPYCVKDATDKNKKS